MKYLLVIVTILLSLCVGYTQQITIEKNTEGYLVEIKTPIPTFQKINLVDSIPILPQATYIYKKGAPELQKIVESFNSNSLTSLDFEILIDSIIDISAAITPSAGFVYQDQPITERTKGIEYSNNIFYPENTINAFEPAFIKDKIKQAVWFNVLQYNAISEKLRIHTYLKIKITDKANVLKASKSELIENKKLLLIVPDSLIHIAIPFIAWKRQLGIEVFVHSLFKTTSASEIKSIINKYYSTNKISYVLIMGDHAQVPAQSSIYGPSDYINGLVNGSDPYIDLAIGRFPADNAVDLKTMVDKTLSYEQGAFVGNWLTTVGSLASAEGGATIGDNGESDYQHLNLINSNFSMRGFNPIMIAENKVYPMSVSSLFNSGCNYAFYCGHGTETNFKSVTFTNDSVRQLQNNNKYPILVDAACLNGDFTVSDCIAEEFMKAKNAIGPTGTVAMVASTISQLWAPPMLGQDVFVAQLFDTANFDLGTISTKMYAEIIDKYGSGGIETAYTWALFGDPTIRLWKNLPDTITANIPDFIDVTKDSIEIVSEDGSWVSLINDTTLLGIALVENGKALLYHGAISPRDSVIVTVWNNHAKPLIKTLKPINNDGSYYDITSLSTSDNNNNINENNEWIIIKPELTNYGNKTGKQIVVGLSACDSSFYIENPSIYIPELAGQSTIIADGFRVKAKRFFAEGERIQLCFTVSDSSGQTNRKTLSITMHTPIVTLDKITVNNDWENTTHIVKTDSVEIAVILTNSGQAPAYDYQLELLLPDLFITYRTNKLSPITIAPASSDTLYLTANIHPNCIEGHLFSANILLNTTLDSTFLFYYKSKTGLIVSDESYITDSYPFYNYYKSNKSQILYTADALLNQAMIIDSVGFNLAAYSNNSSYRNFKNFTLKLVETDSTMIHANFNSIPDTCIVFQSATLTLPALKGWHFFNIADFNYTGTKNVLMEIAWGPNSIVSSYSDIFETYASKTSYTSVVYGFSDFNTPPEVKGTSNLLPMIYFANRSKNSNLVKLIISKELFKSTDDVIYLKMGEQVMPFMVDDTIALILPTATMHYTLLNSYNTIIQEDSIQITNTQTLFVLGNTQSILDHHLQPTTISCSYTNNKLNIVSTHMLDGSIALYTLEGRLVIHEKLSQILQYEKQINLKNGVYFVHIHSAKTNDSVIKKLIVIQ